MPKNKKHKPSKLQQEYRRIRKQKQQFLRRAEKRGWDFPEDIIPDIPEKITRKSINELKKLTPEVFYSKALGLETEEGLIPTKEAKLYEKEKRKRTAIKNLFSKRKSPVFDEDIISKGYELVKKHDELIKEDYKSAFDFIRSLSPEEYELYVRAKERMDQLENQQKKEIENGSEDQTGREARKDILSDEGSESYGDEDEDQDTDYSQQQRAKDDEVRRTEKEKTDEKVRQWKERYEKEKKKPKKDRQFVHDGDAIYAGMISRINQFNSEMGDPKFAKLHEYNNTAKNSLIKALNNEIKIEGFGTVMRRLDKNGIEIDNALETLLYNSQQGKVDVALMQLMEIIYGHSLNQQEAEEVASLSEYFSFSDDEETLENIPIDYDV